MANEETKDDDGLIEKLIHKGYDDREKFQQKIFTTWLNTKLMKAKGSPQITDIFNDFRDGKTLLLLAEVLTGKTLKPVRGNLRLHHLNNLTLALNMLEEYNVKLVGINNQAITDGDKLTTMGLSWNIIYRFQVIEALKGHSEKELLEWCRDALSSYSGVDVKSFQPKKWRDGYAFNALLHAFKPGMFQYSDLTKLDDSGRLNHAFSHAHNNFQVAPIFEAKDFGNDSIDSRTLVMYISALYEKMRELIPAAKRGNADVENEIKEKLTTELMSLQSKEQLPSLKPFSTITLKDLHKRYSGYPEIFNDLRASKNNIINLKNEVESVQSSDLTQSFQQLQENYNRVRKQASTCYDVTKTKLVETIIEQLQQVGSLVEKYTVDEQKSLAELKANPTSNTLKNIIKLTNDMISSLTQMQPLVKYLYKISEQLAVDQKLPEENCTTVKTLAKHTKKDFETLLAALSKLHKTSNDELLTQEKRLGEHGEAWLKRLKNLQEWMTGKIDVYSNETDDIHQTLEKLEKKTDEIEVLSNEMKERWKEYQDIGTEWNDHLCDQIKSDEYVNLLTDVKDNFNKLNQILFTSNSRYAGKINELKSNQKLNLENWKLLFEQKYQEFLILERDLLKSSPSVVDINTVTEWLDKLKSCEKEVDVHSNDVKSLIARQKVYSDRKLLDSSGEDVLKNDIISMQKLLTKNEATIDELKQTAMELCDTLKSKGKKIYGSWCDQLEPVEQWVSKKQQIISVFSETNAIANIMSEITDHVDDVFTYQSTMEKFLTSTDEVLASEDLSKEKKAIVSEKVASVTKNWNDLVLSTKALEAKVNADKQSKLDDWKMNLSMFNAYVFEKNKELNDINRESEVQVAMRDLESLISELTNKESDVKALRESSKVLVEENVLSESSQLVVHAELKKFDNEWDVLNERVQDTHLSLKIKCEQENDIESHALQEWEEKAGNITFWLDGAEREYENYADLPDDLQSLEVFSMKYEALVFKLTTEEKVIDEQLEFGTTLANSGKIKNETNKEKLKNDIKEFRQRKSSLNGKLLQQQQEMISTMDNLKDLESSQFDEWLTAAANVKETLQEFENVGQEDIVKTIDEAESSYGKQEKLVAELNAYQCEVDMLIEQGNDLVEERKLGEQKTNEIKHEMNLIVQKWKLLQDRILTVHARYKDILVGLKKNSNDQSENTLSKVTSFKDWLQFAKHQLEVGKTPTKSTRFNDILQREHGLKKLSADLGSRTNEFDNFVAVATTLSVESGKKPLSEKNAILLDRIQDLQNDWISLIDTIDSEFKNLYDIINCLLDDKRGKIDKSLKLIKENLNSITECNDSREKMKVNSRKLSDLTNELTKLKSQISKLSQQTVALSDVTVFMDNEKELLKQSKDELIADYESCVKNAGEARERLRDELLDMFNMQVEDTKATIANLISQRPVYDGDEQRLSVLNNYMVCDQRIINEAKVEHVKIDDLEQFAEEISAHGMFDSDDQVLVAEIINEALKQIEDLRQECKTRINRVYAVTMLVLKNLLQTLNEHLQKLKDNAQEIDKQEIKEFDHASNVLKSLMKVEEQSQEISAEMAELNREINELVQADVLDLSDIKKLQERNSTLLNDAVQNVENVAEQNKRSEKESVALVLKKLDEFWGWLPIMQKRSEESNEIGPELNVVKKQQQEMKVIDQQSQEKSFQSLIDGENKIVMNSLNENDTAEVNSANDEWLVIRQWVNKRTKVLNKSRLIWEDFERNKVDLLDYLKENQNELKSWNQLDFNDRESVDARQLELKNIVNGMEVRKEHVDIFNAVTDELLQSIGDEGHVANNVRSDVRNLHDLWNTIVKKSIENGTKLQRTHKILQHLEENMKESKDWIKSANQLLNELNEDMESESIEALIPRLQEKEEELEKMQKIMDAANNLNKGLNDDDDTRSHFSTDSDIDKLNDEFDAVVKQFEELKSMSGKGPCYRWFYMKFRHTNSKKQKAES